MISTPSPVEKRTPSDGGKLSFYEKAAGMLLAAGAATTAADAGVVSWQGSGVTDTGDLTPGGLISLSVIGTTHGSTAYGFVKGIGNLSLPSGSLARFFRQASAPTVGPGNEFEGIGGSWKFFGYTENNPAAPLNNAEQSSDNLFAFSFTSGAVNGGSLVFGWARLEIPAGELLPGGDHTFGGRITAWAYDDTGDSIQLGAIPEPSSLALLAAGAVGGVACFHRFRNRRRPE